MNILGPVNSLAECCDSPKQAESPNLLETFRRKQARLQAELANVQNVIVALEKNPEFNSLLELIAKAR